MAEGKQEGVMAVLGSERAAECARGDWHRQGGQRNWEGEMAVLGLNGGRRLSERMAEGEQGHCEGEIAVFRKRRGLPNEYGLEGE